jgi:serine/threonine protein kinase
MEIAIKLRHPSIIECIDCGQERGELFIVMPYCAGGNLSQLLKRSGTLTVRRSLRLMDRILAGMEVAHQQGIVHRDLKPQNILLSREGTGKYRPLISDFGLAKSYLLAGDSGMTVNGTVGGSWAYMPKEQLTNFRFVTPQSDVWSLGAILYECLAQRPPRLLSPGCDPIRAVLAGTVDPIEELLPELPHRLGRFIMKAVAVEAVDRFKDAKQMRAALRTVARLEGVPL